MSVAVALLKEAKVLKTKEGPEASFLNGFFAPTGKFCA
jgi:hypothetical protein